MFNRIHDDLEEQRRSDEELDEFDAEQSSSMVAGADDDSEHGGWLAELEGESADVPPIEESEGMRLVAEAMRRRLDGISIGSCTSERIALSLDISTLLDEEKDALRTQSVPGVPDGALAFTVLVGLLLKNAVVLAPELEEIGVDPDILETDWVEALDERLKEEVSEHLAANAYDQACLLSEAKARHLYSPVSTLKRTRMRDSAIDSAWDGSDRPGPRALGTGRAAVLDETRRRKRRAKLRIVLAAMAVGVLGFVALQATRSGEAPEIHHFTGGELNTISRYVISGYRDGQGKGARLVGSVDRDWLELDLPERIATMRELTERLAEEGVEEIILYDADHAIRVHAAAGQLRLPRETQTASSAVLSSGRGG